MRDEIASSLKLLATTARGTFQPLADKVLENL
jgi:hypothetical protein